MDELQRILDTPQGKAFRVSASQASSAVPAPSSMPSSSSSSGSFLDSIACTSSFSSIEGYDSIKVFNASISRAFPNVVLDDRFDFADWIAQISSAIAMFPRLATGVALPPLRSSIHLSDQTVPFNSDYGLLAIVNEVLLTIFGFASFSQRDFNIKFEAPASYHFLRMQFLRLSKKLAYKDLLLPSSWFQQRVRLEAEMPIPDRDSQPLIVWGDVIYRLREVRADARDEDSMRRLLLSILEKVRSPHMTFFLHPSDPTQPSFDSMMRMLLHLHSQGLNAFSQLSTPSTRPILPAITPSPATAPAASSASVTSISAPAFQSRSQKRKFKKQAVRQQGASQNPSRVGAPSSPAPRNANMVSFEQPSAAGAPSFKARQRQFKFDPPSPPVQDLYKMLNELLKCRCSTRVDRWLDKVNTQISGEVKFQSPFRAARDLFNHGSSQAQQLIRELRDIHRTCVHASSSGSVSVSAVSLAPASAAASSHDPDSVYHVASFHSASSPARDADGPPS